MAAATRIYLVSSTDGAKRLVTASVASQAITHVAKSAFSVRAASQDDLVRALGSGVKVETYGETAQAWLEI